MKILFLHGWKSVPGSVKPTFLANAGHEIINPKLDDEDFGLAVEKAQTEYDTYQPDVIVGSSRGGAVAMNIESGDTPLVLLCPAWKSWGSSKSIKSNSVVLHSKNDDVIPFADSKELVTNSKLLPKSLIEIGDDHRLADEASLKMMLSTCEQFSLTIIGIDPASAKGMTYWQGDISDSVTARDSSDWINSFISNEKNALICWDSPLSFDCRIGLSDRPVEKILRAEVKRWITDGLLEAKSVSVLPFSGCSHWVISCQVLGLPFTNSKNRKVNIANSKDDVRNGGAWVLECHPAIAMAIWWLEKKRSIAFPVYKNNKTACRIIAEELEFSDLCNLKELDDDYLDAYVAYQIGKQFMAGNCTWVGDSNAGGFVLPNSAESNWNLRTKVEKLITKTRAA